MLFFENNIRVINNSFFPVAKKMIFCWYRGFCHRTESDFLLFLFGMQDGYLSIYSLAAESYLVRNKKLSCQCNNRTKFRSAPHTALCGASVDKAYIFCATKVFEQSYLSTKIICNRTGCLTMNRI